MQTTCFCLFSSVVVQNFPLLQMPTASELTLPPSCVHSPSDKLVGDILAGFDTIGGALYFGGAAAAWFELRAIIPLISAVARIKRFIVAYPQLCLPNDFARPHHCLLTQAQWTTPSLSVVKQIEPESHLFRLSTTFPPKPLHSALVSADGDIFAGLTGATGRGLLSTARAPAALIVANNRAHADVATIFCLMPLPS